MRVDVATTMIGRLVNMNDDNRQVLNALEDGRIRTHLNSVDTTEADKALYRDRIADLENLIGRVRRAAFV